MKRFLTILFLTTTAVNGFAQTPAEKILFCEDEICSKLDLLKAEFSDNKTIPEEYEMQCLLALSYFPELKKENIEFVYSKGAYSMAARPAPLSLLGKKKNRKYRIFINTESKNQGLLLHEVPFNAQVGIIGHELAHILDYTQKSVFRIMRDGIGYSSEKFRAKFEHATDKIAIDRGLGWQVLEFCSSTHESESVPQQYKEYKNRVYMTPASIKEYIGGCCAQ
jgi:hypothetical protein